ncbi:hypothetical protein SAMN06265222_11832 [Neorhodopirellula lusitana]|uniref:AAA+ ATPase domain-containing protein n=1 Tax=Neorhodopirellula lusitana TaxID=445327 RepID=A0ABY1QM74_9BACT|nr:hypothetical protein SAMN06265222_11832 [Neorhodopirellula lusitana]
MDSQEGGQPIFQHVPGMELWASILANNKAWTHLCAAVPGDLAQAIQPAFFHRKISPIHGRRSQADPRTEHTSTIITKIIDDFSETIPLDGLLQQSELQAILLGETGGGKTSALRWLAFQTINGKFKTHKIPIVVNLAEYAAEVARRPSCSLLEYFFQSLNSPSLDCRRSADQLRKHSEQTTSTLLLLDDWHQVPLSYRELVQERVISETNRMSTVLATRPHHVLPDLSHHGSTTAFQLCKLDCAETQELTVKTLVRRFGIRPTAAQQLAVQSQAQRKTLPSDPSWIIQHAFILASQHPSQPHHETTNLFRQLVRWDQQLISPHVISPLARSQQDGETTTSTLQHTSVLAELAAEMLFAATRPRRRFFADELEQIAYRHQCSSKTLLESRLLRKSNPILEEFEFTSDSFLVYLAAVHLARPTKHAWCDEKFDAAMTSPLRFEVLLHYAAIKRSEHPQIREHAKRWSTQIDEGKIILLRLARLLKVTAWDQNRRDQWAQSIQLHLQSAYDNATDESFQRACSLLLGHEDSPERDEFLAINSIGASKIDDREFRARRQSLKHWVADCLRVTQESDDPTKAAALATTPLHTYPTAELKQLIDWELPPLIIQLWTQFTWAPLQWDAHPLNLLARLIMAIPTTSQAVYLSQGIDALELAIDQLSGDQQLTRWERLAQVLIQCGLPVEPERVLRFASGNVTARKSLVATTRKLDWLWIGQQLFDNDGNLIASLKSQANPLSTLSTPQSIAEIAQELPPRQRSDFLSYWHMIAQGGDDYIANDRQSIYRDICAVLDSEINNSLSEQLAACYRDGSLPAFTTWRKNLARVVQRCEARPHLLAHLHRIGLGNYRRKPR